MNIEKQEKPETN